VLELYSRAGFPTPKEEPKPASSKYLVNKRCAYQYLQVGSGKNKVTKIIWKQMPFMERKRLIFSFQAMGINWSHNRDVFLTDLQCRSLLQVKKHQNFKKEGPRQNAPISSQLYFGPYTTGTCKNKKISPKFEDVSPENLRLLMGQSTLAEQHGLS